MKRPIEVTVPITVNASLTFHAEKASDVTPELIALKIADARMRIDRRGEDEAGVYFTIESHGEPQFHDLTDA